MKNIFLIMGLILSICSKFLQFKFESSLGDVLILPAALFFVLAILLYNNTYSTWLAQEGKKKTAQLFAFFCCLTVLSFQLFTMFTFGRGYSSGIGLLVPTLIFGGVAALYFRKLYSTP